MVYSNFTTVEEIVQKYRTGDEKLRYAKTRQAAAVL
jgi:hypothetical protein